MGNLSISSTEAIRWVVQASVTLSDGRTVPIGYLADYEGAELESIVVYGPDPVIPEDVLTEIQDILTEAGDEACGL